MVFWVTENITLCTLKVTPRFPRACALFVSWNRRADRRVCRPVGGEAVCGWRRGVAAVLHGTRTKSSSSLELDSGCFVGCGLLLAHYSSFLLVVLTPRIHIAFQSSAAGESLLLLAPSAMGCRWGCAAGRVSGDIGPTRLLDWAGPLHQNRRPSSQEACARPAVLDTLTAWTTGAAPRASRGARTRASGPHIVLDAFAAWNAVSAASACVSDRKPTASLAADVICNALASRSAAGARWTSQRCLCGARSFRCPGVLGPVAGAATTAVGSLAAHGGLWTKGAILGAFRKEIEHFSQ